MGPAIDSLGLFEVTAGLPEQVERAAAGAAALTTPLPDRDQVENVVVLGMGGSGIAGDVLAALAGSFLSVPVVVSKGYAVPSFVGPNTLVFAISFSGDTEETIEAANAAAMAGGRMVVVAAGGRLGRLADEWGAPHVVLPDDIPMPRAGIGAVAIPPLVVLERIGLFPGATSWIDAAVTQLRHRRDALVADGNEAEVLARRIGRTIPLLYGAGRLGEVAAERWKCQVNENAKAPAFANAQPELCHNEICGWGQHGDVTRQVFQLVNLRHEFEHPQEMRRFDLVSELMREVVGDVHEVVAEGEGVLAQLLDLVLVGDFTTLHMAVQAGVDPGPIPVLEDLKAALGTDLVP